MIPRRNIALYVILSLVTCGLFAIYWFIVLTDDIGRMSGDPSFTGLKHFLLTLVTCGVWSFIWAYQAGKQMAYIQSMRGYQPTDNSVLYLILSIFGMSLINYALIQNDVNQLA